MKIYASKRNKTDIDIFKDFKGKDAWIKVLLIDADLSDKYIARYMRWQGQHTGLYNRIWACVVDSTDITTFEWLYDKYVSSGENSFIDYLLNDDYYADIDDTPDSIQVVYPIEVLTTDELLDILRDRYPNFQI